MLTCRTISHCGIFCQDHHRASSSPCSHGENLSSILQAARWDQGLLTWSVVSCYFLIIWSRACMVCLSEGILGTLNISKAQQHRRTWHGQAGMGRRTCFLGCAVGERKYGNAECASDTNFSDALYTGKGQSILITEKCYCSLPTYYLGIIQSHEKIRPSKPPSITEMLLGFVQRHCKCPWVELLPTHHQWSRHHGHQRAEAKTEHI